MRGRGDKISVRVQVAELLKKVEAARARAVKEHAAALKKFEKEQVVWQDRVVAALETALTNARKGKLPKVNYNGVQISVAGEPPDKSGRPDLKEYDRDINILKMASDDTIIITTDNHFVKYL